MLDVYRSRRIDCGMLEHSLPDQSGFQTFVDLVPMARMPHVAVNVLTQMTEPGRIHCTVGAADGRVLSRPPCQCKDCRCHMLAKSLDLQIMQRKLQALPRNLSPAVRLYRKSLMFAINSHSVVVRHDPCVLSSYDLSWRPSVTQPCGERIRKPCHV